MRTFAPNLCARRIISLTGGIVPVTFDMEVRATSFVFFVRSFLYAIWSRVKSFLSGIIFNFAFFLRASSCHGTRFE